MVAIRQLAVVVGTWAAVLGGAFWAVKAGGIMLTGEQPPWAFELAPLLFPIAVVGLYSMLDGARSRSAVAGLVLAGGAELAAVVSVMGMLLGPDSWSPNHEAATPLSPFIAFAALATLLGLYLIGISIRRRRVLPSWRSWLPQILAISAVPLIAFGAVLQALEPRLFEAPTLVIGVGWMTLGVAMSGRHRSWVRPAGQPI